MRFQSPTGLQAMLLMLALLINPRHIQRARRHQVLTRFLLCSHQFRTQGIAARTSYWLPDATCPSETKKHINACGTVLPNLSAHVLADWSFSSAQSLLDVVASGPTTYGLAALAPGNPLSSGARMLVDALRGSEEPLYVLCWGGTNTVAQALQYIEHLPAQEQEALR
ncbi:MAG: hypothetical protein MMC23_001522 [Stictis urceolatum]|nr:hypothetical protein [Stictis urceolata]